MEKRNDLFARRCAAEERISPFLSSLKTTLDLGWEYAAATSKEVSTFLPHVKTNLTRWFSLNNDFGCEIHCEHAAATTPIQTNTGQDFARKSLFSMAGEKVTLKSFEQDSRIGLCEKIQLYQSPYSRFL